jgi:hypothetical protein
MFESAVLPDFERPQNGSDRVISVTEWVFYAAGWVCRPAVLTICMTELTLSVIELIQSVTELTLSVIELIQSVTDITLSVIELTLSATELTLFVIELTLSVTELTLSVVELTLSVTELTLSIIKMTVTRQNMHGLKWMKTANLAKPMRRF